jgi:3'-5' exoribonuclease
VATTYTVEGNLLGHISIASDEVAETAKELGIDGEEVMLLRPCKMIALYNRLLFNRG